MNDEVIESEDSKSPELINLRKIVELTGKNYRTVKKRLNKITPVEDSSGALFYSPPVALAEIYKADYDSGGTEDLAYFRILREKSEAKLAQMKAKRLSLEIKQMKGRLILLEEAEKNWTDMASAFRSRMLAIPSRAAMILHGLETEHEVEAQLKDLIYEALSELSQALTLTQEQRGEGGRTCGTSSEVEAE